MAPVRRARPLTPTQPSPDLSAGGRGGCPHSGDAQSTAQIMAKEHEGIWETEGAEVLAGSRLPTVRAQPACKAEAWAQDPTSGRTHRGVRRWPRPDQPRARLHTRQEPAQCVWRCRERRRCREPQPWGPSPTAGAVCFRGPGACRGSGWGRHRGGTEGLQGSDTPLHDTARPSTSVNTHRKCTKSDP